MSEGYPSYNTPRSAYSVRMADTVAFGRRKTSGGAPPPIMGIGCVRTAQTIINPQWRSAGLSTMNGCNTPLSDRWAAESSYKNPTSPNSFAETFRTTNTQCSISSELSQPARWPSYMSFFDGVGGFLRSRIYQDPRTRLGSLVGSTLFPIPSYG